MSTIPSAIQKTRRRIAATSSGPLDGPYGLGSMAASGCVSDAAATPLPSMTFLPTGDAWALGFLAEHRVRSTRRFRRAAAGLRRRGDVRWRTLGRQNQLMLAPTRIATDVYVEWLSTRWAACVLAKKPSPPAPLTSYPTPT